MVRLGVCLALLTMIFSKVNYSDWPVSFMVCIDSHERLAPNNVSYHKIGRHANLVLSIYLDVTTTPRNLQSCLLIVGRVLALDMFNFFKMRVCRYWFAHFHHTLHSDQWKVYVSMSSESSTAISFCRVVK